ncbi:fumarylacetoacetate hydrolase family protein [Alkalicoccobacillus plakortidis]|uniref:Fumarylacetoacetate hydrolase family protein n=1 Tax=Alkalicoccobacillus plakortidis TaxID=444060 RepID=A0ABT0XEZ4_9BACI|nr:fumarylacetoacetate hydrolase family protein [Alkalicoccobacillus plakortidis]MCM2674468.1 fumarylacetoacetate hydrolase family protein [Alkalicoccobacillus plakortidis]
MRICNITENGQDYLGVVIDGRIVHISKALEDTPQDQVPKNVSEFIKGGQSAFESLQSYVQKLVISDSQPYVVKETDCEFGPAVPNPSKIICVGLNYRRHADETGANYPEVPILFNKFNNTLTGHNRDIAIPNVTDQLDYEVELAVVIGQKAKNVSEEDALKYVVGYSTANDLSARDLQMKTPQWLLGKTCDDFSPIGPYLVTADEVDDPQNLSLKTTVNQDVRQQSNTSDMIFSCKEIISYISKHFTLEPGDIILTGTPEGVVLGLPESERVYLKPGDTVTVEIEKLGALTNTFIEEK